MAIWSGKISTKKYQVKVKGLKLEELLLLPRIEDQKRVKMGIEMKWEGPQKSGFSSFYKKTQVQSYFTKEIELNNKFGEPIEWNNIEFDNICSFSISSKDPSSFAPWIVSFHILYGDCGELPSSSSSKSLGSGKMQVLAKARLNLGELATNAQIEQNIPIPLELDGFVMKQEPSLHVTLTFIELTNTSHLRTLSHDSYGNVQNQNSASDSSTSVLRRANSQGFLLTQEKTKKNKTRLFGKQLSLKHTVEPTTTDSSESDYVVVASSSKSSEPNSVTETRSSLSSETQLDLVKKGGFWKWKRRKSMKKVENAESSMDAERSNDNPWEEKELVSRDGKTKLNAKVFFASFDQRSEKAAGENACAAIVAVVAHWLQLFPDMIFTASEFDRLITEGSSEWRKLCHHESNKNSNTDQHFDLETILGAQLRPLAVLPNNSRFGFFHPEEFEHIKDAASFDAIWNEINTNVSEFDSKVYIVRWNQHFFLLKVESNANYIIDSLGERLYEGCNQAYVLKFDDSTVIYEKEGDEKGEYKEIYRGKECCREYMKRFLAAIALRELKEEEAKGKTVEAVVLYERLQIDFHLSSNSSTANTSITASPDTEPHFFRVDA